MRRFLLRSAAFLSPFVVYALYIVLIDPFRYIGWSHIIPDTEKRPIAAALNPCLWKLSDFDRHPVERIMLGDSRMDAIRLDDVTAVTHAKWANLAYGGASMREIIDTFWFAARRTPLKDVYIGLNLNVYNDYNVTDRVAAFTSVHSNPGLYFVNRTVIHAALLETYSHFRRKDLKIGIPQMDRESFWRDQIGPYTTASYTNYVYPARYRKQLREIGDYCRHNAIRLRFVIFPTHIDLQHRLRDFGLETAAVQFRKDLAEIGQQTFDFDYPNEITANRDNFNDPYHYNEAVGRRLVDEIWAADPKAVPRSGASAN